MCDHSQCPCQIEKVEEERREAEHDRWLEKEQDRKNQEAKWVLKYFLVAAVFGVAHHYFPDVKIFGVISGAYTLAAFCCMNIEF